MSKHKRDCLETYGLDFPLTLITMIVAAFILCSLVMLAIEAVKDILN